MSNAKAVRYLSLSALAAISVLIGTGWSKHAGAWQGRPRPFIPRPSDVRPLSRAQTPTASAPVPSPGDKAAPAQNAPPPANPNEQKARMAGLDLQDPTMDEKTGIVTGRDFTYTVDDMTVTGAKAHYNKNTRVLDADGNLVLDNPKHHVTGDKAHVDDSKKAKLAIFTGSVVIVLKPKTKQTDSAGNEVAGEKGKGGTIFCDRVDDWYKKEFVILTGHLTFKQKITKQDGRMVERSLTADHAEYDGKNDKMHLFAPVDAKDTDNQEMHFKKDVFVGTKEGEETLKSDGPSSMTFIVNDENDDAEDNSSGKTPAIGDKTPAPAKQEPPPVGTDNKQGTPVKKSP